MENRFVTRLQRPLFVGVSALCLGIAACSSTHSDSRMIAPSGDGDVAVPADYASWTKFVPTIDKPNGQVREIYINNRGMQATRGEAFPPGTISVMEIYASRKDARGNPATGDNGRLVKGELAKVFVMAKGDGWGQKLPAGTIDNGDWLYAAYEADAKTPATNDFSKCRECHAPMAGDDYIARYGEHFDNR